MGNTSGTVEHTHTRTYLELHQSYEAEMFCVSSETSGNIN